MNLNELLKQLVPVIGEMAAKKLADELEDVAGDQTGWKKTVLALVANAVEQYGPAGINMAMEALENIQKGKAPQIDWADLRIASDILAELQNAEADKKKAAQDYLVRLSQVLGLILAAVVKGLMSAA